MELIRSAEDIVKDIADITKQAKKIENLLADYEPLIFPALIPTKYGSSLHLLFNIPKEIWHMEQRVNSDLYQKLQTISKITPVIINPESFI